MSFPGSSADKVSACNAGILVRSQGQECPLEKGISPGTLQYSCLEYSIQYIISACNLYKNYLCITLN